MCFLFITTINAQEQVAGTQFSIGPFLSVKAGVNGGNAPMGRQNAVHFNGLPDFGASGIIFLDNDRELGLGADLSYLTLSYRIEGYDVKKNFNLKYSYIALSPFFYFRGFSFGFNFGLPVNADFDADINTSILNPIVEVRLGALIPVMQDEDGSLNIIANASYTLNGLYKDFANDDPLLANIPANPEQNFTNKFNPRVVSVSVGINYMFNLAF